MVTYHTEKVYLQHMKSFGFNDSSALDRALKAKRQIEREKANTKADADRVQKDKEKKGEALPPIVEQAYKQILEKLKDPAYVVDMDSFKKHTEDGQEKGVYSPEEVEKDKAEVSRLNGIFQKDVTPEHENANKMAKLFEGILMEQSELSNWLGENAKTVMTAPFDDYKNGVDMYAEWSNADEGAKLLALAVDITFSPMALNKKFDRIKDEIDRDELGQIKYFRDEHGDFMGRRTNVPRAVIGVSPRVIQDLSALLVNKDNAKLGVHPVQRLIVEQISEQLTVMRNYAEESGSNNALRAYTQALSVINSLVEEKTGEGAPELGMLAYDTVANAIKLKAKNTFGVKVQK